MPSHTPKWAFDALIQAGWLPEDELESFQERVESSSKDALEAGQALIGPLTLRTLAQALAFQLPLRVVGLFPYMAFKVVPQELRDCWSGSDLVSMVRNPLDNLFRLKEMVKQKRTSFTPEKWFKVTSIHVASPASSLPSKPPTSLTHSISYRSGLLSMLGMGTLLKLVAKERRCPLLILLETTVSAL